MLTPDKISVDTEVKMVPNLLYYDWIVINSSAGKDSQASMDVLIKRALQQGFPLDRIVVAHAVLEEEWAGTKELAAEHAAHYGLAYFEFKRPQGSLLDQVRQRRMWPSNAQRYCTSDHKRGQIAKLFTYLTQLTRRNRDPNAIQGGPSTPSGNPDSVACPGAAAPVERQPHDHADQRSALPGLAVRRTVDVGRRHLVRDQGDPGEELDAAFREDSHDGLRASNVEQQPLLRRDRRRNRKKRVAGKKACRAYKKVRILSVFGFRAEESPARRKMRTFEKDERLTNTLRHVDRWLPIHHFKERQVWQQIKKAGTRVHWAYARGMKRLSCVFCIFAPRSQLLIAASQPENKDKLKEYVHVELTINHKFRVNQSLAEIQQAVEAGETGNPEEDSGCWNM